MSLKKVSKIPMLGKIPSFLQHIVGVFQSLEGSLNAYLDKCLTSLYILPNSEFYISRHYNSKANMLDQQASGFNVRRLVAYKKMNYIKEMLLA